MRKITHYLLGKINKSGDCSTNNETKALKSVAIAVVFFIRLIYRKNLKYFAMKNLDKISLKST